LVLAPGTTAGEASAGRREIQAARHDGALLLPEPGEIKVIAVGEDLKLTGLNRRALPSGAARSIEEALALAPLDICHLHDPLPPSVPAAALRHSRALNVGHFHQPTPRFPASDVGRRVGGAIFGRLDAAVADFATAISTVEAAAPAGCRKLARAVDSTCEARAGNSDVLICQLANTQRGSLRTLIRALRRLPSEGWRARIAVAPGSPEPTGLSPIRDLVEIVEFSPGSEAQFLAGADIVVAGGGSGAVSPESILHAIANQAVPVASTLPVHTELLEDGRLGPGFVAGDADTLSAQLAQLISSSQTRDDFVRAAAGEREQLSPERLVDQIEGLFLELVAKRHDSRHRPEAAEAIAERPLIDVDLHMHTDHSHDCVTPVEVLLSEARHRGLGAIAVTDHNEISGALEAAAKAEGIKVIVGEEVKTKSQGEVIGLFIKKKIPAGLSLRETIDEIHDQGGIAYVPHPFDRMHSVPDYEHLLEEVERIDAIEVYNARVAIGEFNEEAARFAAKYRIPAGAGSDAHVAQGLGSVRIRMRDFDGPEEFLESLREADIVRSPSSLLFVQALKFIQTKATPETARKASKRRRVKRAERKS
jgi:hypothetical protein